MVNPQPAIPCVTDRNVIPEELGIRGKSPQFRTLRLTAVLVPEGVLARSDSSRQRGGVTHVQWSMNTPDCSNICRRVVRTEP